MNLICANQYSEEIEYLIREKMGCAQETLGFVDSSYIKHHTLEAVRCLFSYLYATAGEERKETMQQYLNNYEAFLSIDMDELLETKGKKYESPEKELTLPCKNGEETIKKYIDELKKVAI